MGRMENATRLGVQMSRIDALYMYIYSIYPTPPERHRHETTSSPVLVLTCTDIPKI